MGQLEVIPLTFLGYMTMILVAFAGDINRGLGSHEIDDGRIVEGNVAEEILELTYQPQQ